MRRSFFCAALSAALLLALAACGDGMDEDAMSTAETKLHGLGGHGGHGTTASSSHATTSSSTHASTSSSTASTTHATTASATASTTHATTASSTSSTSSSSGATGGGGTLFTAANPWNTPIDADPKSASSDTITQWLAANGGWGDGEMRIDFSINLLTADASTPFLSFTPTGDFYSPDCDHVPFPVPTNGAVEGEQGYTCTHDGDCHLLVVHPPTHKLYEMWRANITGGTFDGGCTAVWDLSKSYPANLRGDGCTSADAGGFPIASMLFSPDEVFAQQINHAIRFILPNDKIRSGVYVHPGSHTTSSTSGPASAPPYGVRLRLRADYPLANLPSDGARVVARAMQKYGLFLADGGTIALTAANDAFTQHTWDEVGVDTRSLVGIQVTDMEVVDMGTPMTNNDCQRNP